MSNILSIYNNPIAGGVYSDTPTQIGVWIDGTPVWRYAFNKDIDSEDMTWSDKVYMVFTDRCFKNDINVFCIGGYAWLKLSSSSNKPCWIDDRACTGPTTGSAFEFLDVLDTSQYSGVYGYIDFVSEKDNINFNNFN